MIVVLERQVRHVLMNDGVHLCSFALYTYPVKLLTNTWKSVRLCGALPEQIERSLVPGFTP